MIKIYDARGEELPLDLASGTLPTGAVLVDLLNPSRDEVVFVEHGTGLELPSAHRIAEVETSSRLSMQGDALEVTTPVVYRTDDASVKTSPVGFVLIHGLLITIRFVELKSFSDFLHAKPFRIKDPAHGGVEVFLSILEIIVDRMADAMEQVGADLDTMSHSIYEPNGDGRVSSKPSRVEHRLTRTLKAIGRNGDLTSHARNSLLGLGRLVAYVGTHAGERMTGDSRIRLDTLKQDIASLNDYETRLTDKVQFLLDSTLGFINIEQNRTFKLLTIASVIGIPPTFIVGLYGMNFKNMPEYDWSYGYQWGLGLVVISVVVPTLWLRWRGWF